jgi:hypothetical protein
MTDQGALGDPDTTRQGDQGQQSLAAFPGDPPTCRAAVRLGSGHSSGRCARAAGRLDRGRSWRRQGFERREDPTP